MKLVAVLFASLLAVVPALASPAPADSTVSSAVASYTPSPLEQCVLACDPTDNDCRAQCFTSPHPSAQQANQTNECVSQCDQGSGSPADTAAYAKCINSCITSYFLTGVQSIGGTPTAASVQQTGSAAGSAASNQATATGGSGHATGSASGGSSGGSATGTQASASGTGASASKTSSSAKSSGAAVSNLQLGSSAAGFAGLLMAIFAL